MKTKKGRPISKKLLKEIVIVAHCCCAGSTKHAAGYKKC